MTLASLAARAGYLHRRRQHRSLKVDSSVANSATKKTYDALERLTQAKTTSASGSVGDDYDAAGRPAHTLAPVTNAESQRPETLCAVEDDRSA